MYAKSNSKASVKAMNDDHQKGISGNLPGIQASKKKHEQHQANWKEVNKLSLFYAAKASAAFLCQQKGWSVCHGIGCNISPKRPVDENEASIILDFLYLMAKAYNQIDGHQNGHNLKDKSNYEKTLQAPQ